MHGPTSTGARNTLNQPPTSKELAALRRREREGQRACERRLMIENAKQILLAGDKPYDEEKARGAAKAAKALVAEIDAKVS